MLDQVIITDLVARGIIGINQSERKKPQEIWINIILFSDQSKAGKSNDIQDCINYSTVAKKIIVFAETARKFTLEALSADLALLCLEQAGVMKVRVRVETPPAVRLAKSVEVEIERAIVAG